MSKPVRPIRACTLPHERQSLFTPGEPLPEQAGRRHQGTSEQRLCAAILEDALVVLHTGRHTWSPKHEREYDQALAWVMSHDDAYLFSFAGVCGALGLDPDYVRRGILESGFQFKRIPHNNGKRSTKVSVLRGHDRGAGA